MSVSSDDDAVVVDADIEEPAEVAVLEMHHDDDVSDEDDDSVVASVVVDEAEEEAEEDDVAVAIPVAVTAIPKKKSTKKRKKGGTGSNGNGEKGGSNGEKVSSKGEKRRSKGEKSSSKGEKISSKGESNDSSKQGSYIKKKKRKKKIQRGEETMQFARISSERLNAAQAAREMLIHTVPRLPFPITDTHVLRSFGQLHVEGTGETAKFATANALYPVGFSCDRYEFSPVHGRVLKMRCSILDGFSIRERTNGSRQDIPDGPIFRIMWGKGVDEESDKADYPYDPYANSNPVTSSEKDDAIAFPAGPGGTSIFFPERGMRVKVRFEQDQFYTGTIESVVEKEGGEKKKKKRRKSVNIKIAYDDGSSETSVYPDPDIILVMPGRSTSMRF
jgi:hypothetical protein